MALNGDFENQRYFPAWVNLPAGWPFASHWCFLAEIVQCDGFLRYRTIVRDGTGAESVVAFYLDDYDAFDFQTIRPGHTLAIMYAEKHFFLDGSSGVRVEEADHVKVGECRVQACSDRHGRQTRLRISGPVTDGCQVFPCRLEKLQWLGQDIQKYLNEDDGKQKCHGCDAVKLERDMKRCGGCSHFWYCDKDCQAKGWARKGHKRDCKVMQDHDFQAMIRLDFERLNQARFSFRGHVARSVGGVRRQRPATAAEPEPVLAATSPEGPASSTARAVVPRGTTKVVAISLEKEDGFDDDHGLLLCSMRAKAQYESAETPESALAALSALSAPATSVVLVTDAVLCRPEHAGLCDAVVTFVKSGGTAVLMGDFGRNVEPGALATVFAKMGLPWLPGADRRRITFHLDREAVGEALWTQLPSSYIQDALSLQKVARNAAWYRSNEDSVVFDGNGPQDLHETPVAFARVGDGNLGYVGDVQGKEGSHLVVLAMCGLMD